MKRILSLVIVLAVGLGVAFVGGRLTYQFAYAQAIADAPTLDAGPAAPPTITVTAPATSDIAVTAPQASAAEPAPVARTSTTPEPSADAVVDDLVRDVARGDWRYAAAGALTLLMILLRNQRQRIKLFAGKRGGAILVALLGLGASFVAVLMSSLQLSPELFLGAVGTTFTAVGGWHWFRDVITGDGAA